MWIAVIGPTGTCKSSIATELEKKEAFQAFKTPLPEMIPSRLEFEVNQMCSRHVDCDEIAKNYLEKDIVTVRSFWDSIVYSEASFRAKQITTTEHRILKNIYQSLIRSAAPPHGVIYIKPKTQIQSHVRASLTGVKFDQEYEGHLIECYAEHSKQIRIPMVEVELTDQFEFMLSQVTEGVNSFRASHIGGATIWKRSYYR